MKAKERYSVRYVVIVFLILILLVFAFFIYLRNTKIHHLKHDINELTDIHEDYSKIDSCIYVLYQAENNSRLYAVTADKSYIQKFTFQIQRVSALLAGLDVSLNDREESQNLKELVKKKRLKTESYLKARRLADSLILSFSRLGLLEENKEVKMIQPSVRREVKTVVHYDTIKRAPQRKKFFGRLGDAFGGHSKMKDSIIVVKGEGHRTVRSEVKNLSNKQLLQLEQYYRKLYDNTARLRKDEKAILISNSKLIDEIIVVLQGFKKKEIQLVSDSKAALGGELNTQIKALDRIAVVNTLLLVCLFIIILYNIFKLYKNEKALIGLSRKASQDSHSKSRFLANMSHELRTPLNSVIGFSEQLGKGKLNEEQIEQVGAIRSSSEMLLELVNEILDFSKYEVGKINFESSSFSVEAEIMEVFNSMLVLAINKNIGLENEMAFDRGLWLTGDRLRLKQVVMNLLTNAIKFTSSGQVTLKIQFFADDKKKGILKIQIEDTGIGIAKEDLDYIFDEFSQVYAPSKNKQQGTGLGLAICKKIVELQGGKIGVNSSVGKGSVFSFEIPYAIYDKTKEEADATDNGVNSLQEVGPGTTEEPANTGLEGKRILLVDDNKMNILLAQTLLKKWKMQYDSASDGKEALDLFKKNNYDLVLTDIQMPIMGGVELTHEIRYNVDQTKSGIPILGVTAHVLQEDRDAYLKVGMNDLVLKPFLEMELIDKITKYI